jgi:hypothetical protein
MNELVEALERMAFVAGDTQFAIRLAYTDWQPGMDHLRLNWHPSASDAIKAAYFTCVANEKHFGRLADNIKNTLASVTATPPW